MVRLLVTLALTTNGSIVISAKLVPDLIRERESGITAARSAVLLDSGSRGYAACPE